MVIARISIVLALMSCTHGVGNKLDSYPAHPSTRTSAGVPVTENGQHIDLERVDQISAETAECLAQKLPPWELVIVPPADHSAEIGWYISPCTGSQVFYCHLPEGPDPVCPVRCAGVAIRGQGPVRVLVTPNLAALAHELLHVAGYSHSDWPFGQCEHFH